MASFATSYIPTTSAQVTRAADNAVMTGTNFSSWYRQDEGTLLLESSAFGGLAGATVALQNDVYSNAVIWVQSDLRVNGYDGAVRLGSGVLSAQFGASVAEISGSFAKRALAYRVNDFAFSKNGTATLTDTSGELPTPPVRLQLGTAALAAYAGSVSSGIIKRIAYYPKRLPNAQLQALTL